MPELVDRLALRPNCPQLSRIQTRIQLGAASPEGIAEYIEYRLRAVGDQSPFSSDAIAILHEASRGRLRDIDRPATNALRHPAARKVRIAAPLWARSSATRSRTSSPDAPEDV